mmetsp:Transcript_22278/g.27306  ORF Transcript_22278/g.27306 Transcript_22278/m.27306 type:complete len:83 (+) Transcript_22278:28-276(+)
MSINYDTNIIRCTVLIFFSSQFLRGSHDCHQQGQVHIFSFLSIPIPPLHSYVALHLRLRTASTLAEFLTCFFNSLRFLGVQV